MESLKVKVIKASKPSFWYADKIGEIFEIDRKLYDKGYYWCTSEQDVKINNVSFNSFKSEDVEVII